MARLINGPGTASMQASKATMEIVMMGACLGGGGKQNRSANKASAKLSNEVHKQSCTLQESSLRKSWTCQSELRVSSKDHDREGMLLVRVETQPSRERRLHQGRTATSRTRSQVAIVARKNTGGGRIRMG